MAHFQHPALLQAHHPLRPRNGLVPVRHDDARQRQ